IQVNVSHFTPEEPSFTLYADLPDGKLFGKIDPFGEYDQNEDYIIWNVEKLRPMEKLIFTFSLTDLKGEYGETVFYIEGTDPVHVVGAEPLPGDWNIDALKSIIEEEEEEENGEE
ncbi:MAG: DNA topoisomerase VI subunit B, partial [Thermoplasmata archaeon]